MRYYRIYGVKHKIDEEKFRYNMETELNEKASLKEIKDRAGKSRDFKKTPGKNYLRSCGNLVAALTKAGCRMEVYDNGFAIYQTPDRATVIRMEYVGHYIYKGDPKLDRGRRDIDMSEIVWAVSVMMTGEERLEKWRRGRDAKRLVLLSTGFGYDRESGKPVELEIDAGVDVELEVEERMERENAIKCLSAHQRKCAYMYYGLGMTLQEIAGALGVTWLNVDSTLRDAKKNIHRYLQKEEEKLLKFL